MAVGGGAMVVGALATRSPLGVAAFGATSVAGLAVGKYSDKNGVAAGAIAGAAILGVAPAFVKFGGSGPLKFIAAAGVGAALGAGMASIGQKLQ